LPCFCLDLLPGPATGLRHPSRSQLFFASCPKIWRGPSQTRGGKVSFWWRAFIHIKSASTSMYHPGGRWGGRVAPRLSEVEPAVACGLSRSSSEPQSGSQRRSFCSCFVQQHLLRPNLPNRRKRGPSHFPTTRCLCPLHTCSELPAIKTCTGHPQSAINKLTSTAPYQSIASGGRCESVAEKRSEQRTTAYTRPLAHAMDA
jgi:hypothetical protein